ncbi:SDR family NAD(P)-dependent oxidoreductase [Aeromicrobium sp. CF4.19]|uniref:SDR family NAD(P)-dependent oxidoreductase n=1 Tax=Aeromicrobium sp. CF4.19 TaxID=3373082 RepID=UPI003EE8076E
MTEQAAGPGLGLAEASVVVTGGASNIGRAIVLSAAAEGARVTIWDIDVEQAERTADVARRGGGDVSVVRCDATEPDAVDAAVAATVAERGSIDVLVNNVGWNRPAWFASVTAEDMDKAVRVNLMSATYATRAVLPLMEGSGRGGSVVSVASDAAFGELRTSVYGAAKAGVVALMKALALEYGRKGIRFNVVAPGLVIPPGPESVGKDSLWAVGEQDVIDETGREHIRAAVPLRRLSTPEDVAGSVLFFASERLSRQLTGQVVSVSGGKHMPG